MYTAGDRSYVHEYHWARMRRPARRYSRANQSISHRVIPRDMNSSNGGIASRLLRMQRRCIHARNHSDPGSSSSTIRPSSTSYGIECPQTPCTHTRPCASPERAAPSHVRPLVPILEGSRKSPISTISISTPLLTPNFLLGLLFLIVRTCGFRMAAEKSSSDEAWAQAEGVPQLSDPFIQKYLQGRDALVEQEKRQRSGLSYCIRD